jgi:hypothetical protein
MQWEMGGFTFSPSHGFDGRSISTTFRIRRGVFGGLGTSTCERSRGPFYSRIFPSILLLLIYQAFKSLSI